MGPRSANLTTVAPRDPGFQTVSLPGFPGYALYSSARVAGQSAYPGEPGKMTVWVRTGVYLNRGFELREKTTCYRQLYAAQYIHDHGSNIRHPGGSFMCGDILWGTTMSNLLYEKLYWRYTGYSESDGGIVKPRP